MNVLAPRSTSINTSSVRLGDLFVREFDIAVMQCLGGVVNGRRYYVNIAGVPNPPFPDDYDDPSLRRTPMPGIPIEFAQPHDAFEYYVNPCFIVRRQDPMLAMERWNDQRLKYIIPADGSTTATVEFASGIGKDGKPWSKTITGPNKYETQPEAWAYDLLYSIIWRAEGANAETYGQKMLRHVMRRFQPRCGIDVTDDQGNEFRYTMMCDAPTELNELIDIANRVRGWTQTAKILGYFDLKDPYVINSVRKLTQNQATQL
jgi:hypothetical protein